MQFLDQQQQEKRWEKEMNNLKVDMKMNIMPETSKRVRIKTQPFEVKTGCHSATREKVIRGNPGRLAAVK